MLLEEMKAIEYLQEFKPKSYWKNPITNKWVMEDDVYLKNKIHTVLNLIEKLKKENEELKSDNLEKERVLEIFDNRKYRKRYLKERRKEEPNLLYPDGDEIYKRYYELKKQIDLTIEYFLNELHKYTSFGGVAEFCKNKKAVECYKTKCSICIKEYFSKLSKEKGE